MRNLSGHYAGRIGLPLGVIHDNLTLFEYRFSTDQVNEMISDYTQREKAIDKFPHVDQLGDVNSVYTASCSTNLWKI